MRTRDIPNIITSLRMLLVGPVIWLLAHGRYGAALALFAVAGISDALDGYVAKRFAWSSRLGSILDPLADKLLLVSAYFTLGWLGQIPLWLVALVVARDVVIVLGGLVFHYAIGHFELAPTVLSKLNTLAQILLVLSVLVSHGFLPLPDWVEEVFIYGVVLTTLCSGIGYVLTWSMRALRSARKMHNG